MKPAPEIEADHTGIDPPETGRQELGRHWPLLLASVLGISVGIAAIPTNAVAVLLLPMQGDLGWSRAQISLGPTIVLLVVAGVSPLLGWVTDRVRTIWVLAIGLLGLSLTLLLFSRLNGDVGVYYAGCVLMGLAGAGSATIPYARLVSTAFVRMRGFALGLSTIGTGIAAFALPVVLGPYAAAAGWRAGFVALAVTVAIGLLVITVLLMRSPAATRSPVTDRLTGVGQTHAGSTLRDALRGRTLWMLLGCFGLVMFAMTGLQLHLLSYLQDAGVPVGTAALIAGLAGVGVIVVRPLAGCVFDRAYAPHIAAGVFVIAMVCVILLATFGATAAPLAALAIGLATGAEFDLLGYLTARYFGPRSYGRIYGLFYLVATVGAALSGVFYGAIEDSTGSYHPAMYTSAALLVVCAVLMLGLPRYPPLALPTAVSTTPAETGSGARRTSQ